MTAWTIWFAFGAALLMLEMATGTFYLLVIALGAAAAGLAALLGLAVPVQFLVAALVGIAGTVTLRKIRLAKGLSLNSRDNPNISLDIGQTVRVDAWNTASEPPVARVMYRDSPWDAELATGATAEPGYFIIREIRGSRLVVSNQTA